MKGFAFVVLSFTLAIGLFVSGPDTAGASPVSVSWIVFDWPRNSGTVTVSPNPGSNSQNFPWLMTAEESGSGGWTVVGTDADLSNLTPVYDISGGKIEMTAGDPTKAVLSGSINGVLFTFAADTVPGSESWSAGTTGYFSWRANVPDIGGLSSFFSPEGPYADTATFIYQSSSGRITGGGASLAAVPVPASLALFAPGLLALLGIKGRVISGIRRLTTQAGGRV